MTASARSPSSPAAPASSAATWSISCSSAASRSASSTTWSAAASATSPTTQAIRDFVLRAARHPRASRPDDRALRGRRLRLPLRRHRRHRALDRAPARVHVDANVQGTVHVLECARARRRREVRLRGLVVLLRPRRRCRRARTIRSRRSIPTRCRKYQGEQAALPLAPGLPAAGQLDPHLQRLRHRARAPPAPTARCSACSCAEARRQAVHGGRRRHADARLPLRDRRGRGLPRRGGPRPRPAKSGTSAPATRSRSTGWSSCSAATVVHIPKRPGEPDCTWADITKIRRELRLAAEGLASRRASAAIVAEIDYWRDAPLWDPESIAKATEAWFTVLSAARCSHAGRRQHETPRHKIKTAEELRAADRPRPRDEEGDHVPRHLRHRASRPRPPPALRQEQGRHSGRQPHRATRTSPRRNYPPVRAAGAARGQSGRARDGRLRRHRPERRRRSRTSRIIQPDYFAKGYEYTAERPAPEDAGGDGGARGLRRRDDLHARRHRLLVVAR